MAKLILQISEEDIQNRVAVHTSLESYRLMYLINKEMNTYFLKLTDRKDLAGYSTQEGLFFEVFRWRNNENSWVFVKNKLERELQGNDNSLFETISSVSYWDKNHKKADFILEISEPGINLDWNKLCSRLEKIPGVLSTQII